MDQEANQRQPPEVVTVPERDPGWVGRLLARVARAVARLQGQEGFALPELLDSQAGAAAWSAQAGIREAWGLLGTWRPRPDQAPPRTLALAQGLSMLLFDMLLASGAGQAPGWGLSPDQLWSQESVSDRLRHYYQAALGRPVRGGAATPDSRAMEPEAPDRLQETVAGRWQAELLPVAVGLLLGEARIVAPYQAWRDLAERHPQRMQARVALSERGRDLVEAISDIIPQATELLRERFLGIFREVEPSRWEHLKPDVEEVAMILRGRLYSRREAFGGRRPCQGQAQPPRPSPQPSREAGASREFLAALRALVAQGLEERARATLDALEQDMAQGGGQEMLLALKGPVLDEALLANLRELFALVRRLGQARRTLDANDNPQPRPSPSPDLLALTERALRREAAEQGVPWPEVVEELRRMRQEGRWFAPGQEMLSDVVERIAGATREAGGEGLEGHV